MGYCWERRLLLLCTRVERRQTMATIGDNTHYLHKSLLLFNLINQGQTYLAFIVPVISVAMQQLYVILVIYVSRVVVSALQ